MEFKKILFYHRTFEEYRRLKNENDFLKGRLVGMEEVILENKRLEDLLEFKRKLIFSAVAANVVGREPSRWNSTLIVDKGIDDGIEQGQAVVNAYGVVGKVAEVNQNSSKVVLITDPQFSVASMVQRSRESVLVAGSLDGLCRLKFYSETADIVIGDQIITSKLSTTFPENLVIGKVTSIEAADMHTKRISVSPAVSVSQLEEVLILKK